MNILTEFQKRATAAGLTKEQTDKFVSENFLGGKTAEQLLDETYARILGAAGVEKTAQTVAYVDSFLKTALDRGLPEDAAIELTTVAATKLAQYAPAKPQQKVADVQDVATKAYLLGMLEKAASLGIPEQTATALIQKMAMGPGPGPGPAPAGAPPIGAPSAADPGASPDMAQVMQLIKMLGAQGGGAGPAPAAGPAAGGLPPELLQALLAQSGPGAAPAGPGPDAGGMLKQVGQ